MLRTIIPVTTEQLTLVEVRQHLRLPEDETEDELLLGLIKTARAYCENYTRRALAQQTLEVYLDCFPASGPIKISCPPLVSVVEIGYTDSTGLETILPALNYLVDIDCEPGQVLPSFGTTWPVFTTNPASSVRIRFVAGYEELPVSIRLAMLLLVGHWYENREATGTANRVIDFSVHALLTPYRVEVF